MGRTRCLQTRKAGGVKSGCPPAGNRVKPPSLRTVAKHPWAPSLPLLLLQLTGPRSLFVPQNPQAQLWPMEPCRSLALLAGSLGLASSLVAISTDFWIVAVGKTSAHSGLWPKGGQDDAVKGYIHVTQSFCILATLWGLVAVGFLALSCIPSLSAPRRGPLVSTVMALAAALSMLVAMAVYTSERWGQAPHPQVQTFFCWSFYLGWVSAVLFLCAGALSLAAHCGTQRPGYESL